MSLQQACKRFGEKMALYVLAPEEPKPFVISYRDKKTGEKIKCEGFDDMVALENNPDVEKCLAFIELPNTSSK